MDADQGVRIEFVGSWPMTRCPWLGGWLAGQLDPISTRHHAFFLSFYLTFFLVGHPMDTTSMPCLWTPTQPLTSWSNSKSSTTCPPVHWWTPTFWPSFHLDLWLLHISSRQYKNNYGYRCLLLKGCRTIIWRVWETKYSFNKAFLHLLGLFQPHDFIFKWE